MRNIKLYFFIILLTALSSTAIARSVSGLPDLTELVEANHQAVVNISTLSHASAPTFHDIPDLDDPRLQEGPLGEFFRRFLDELPNDGQEAPPRQFERESSGSGFIISADGYVLTNNHVVENADEVTVRLTDRRQFVARVVGSDPRSDIALLKIDANNLPLVRIGSADSLKVGEWVLAIGSPFGFDFSVTAGIVSAKQRALPNENYVPFIQTDVAINPGNSGGPLFNMDGEVVGVNAQIYSRSGGFMGLSFAIPIDMAMEVAEQLKDGGKVKRGWLGVVIQEVTRDLALSFNMDKAYGALISRILPDSPASKSELRVGDVIVAFNGRSIDRSSSLPPIVGRSSLDTPAKVDVVRNGERQTLNVMLGELPGEEALLQARRGSLASPSNSKNKFDIEVTALDESVLEDLGKEIQGVLVRQVHKGVAQEAGILEGDIIVSIDNQLLSSVDEFTAVLETLTSGSTVPVLVERQQGPVFLAVRVP